MKRYGSLLVFKPGVTFEDAERALAGLDGLVDESITYPHRKSTGVDYGKPVLVSKPVVREFDDSFGGPVWYIP